MNVSKFLIKIWSLIQVTAVAFVRIVMRLLRLGVDVKLLDLLKQHEDTILRIKRRLYFLVEFENQFSELTRDRTFRIRNDIVYRIYYDTWDMLVIDFASLSRGMCGEGGFFNQIKANLHEIKPLNKKKISIPKGHISFLNYTPSKEEIEKIKVDMAKSHIKSMMEANRETLYELFPNTKERVPFKVRSEDVDGLKNRFENLIKDVVDDRDKHRAHKYEQDQGRDKHDKLNFDKLNDRFKQMEDLLNKIRLVLDQSTFAYADMNYANPKEVARDMVTMILWGSNKMIDQHSGINDILGQNDENPLDKTYGYRVRDKMIESSHEKYEEILKSGQAPEDFWFNDITKSELEGEEQ